MRSGEAADTPPAPVTNDRGTASARITQLEAQVRELRMKLADAYSQSADTSEQDQQVEVLTAQLAEARTEITRLEAQLMDTSKQADAEVGVKVAALEEQVENLRVENLSLRQSLKSAASPERIAQLEKQTEIIQSQA